MATAPYSIKEYLNEDNSQGAFAVPEYLEKEHLTVTQGTTVLSEGVHYNFNAEGTHINLINAPTVVETITITRNTSQGERLTDHQDGSVLTASALDRDALQLMYIAQEAIDNATFITDDYTNFFSSSTDTPTARNVGDMWYNVEGATGSKVKVWNGTLWEDLMPFRFTVHAQEPTGASTNSIWYDLSLVPAATALKYYNGSSWVSFVSAATSKAYYTNADFTSATPYSYINVNGQVNDSTHVYLNGVKLLPATTLVSVGITGLAGDYFYDASAGNLILLELGSSDTVEVISNDSLGQQITSVVQSSTVTDLTIGSTLELTSDGSDSFIKEKGEGSLFIEGNHTLLRTGDVGDASGVETNPSKYNRYLTTGGQFGYHKWYTGDDSLGASDVTSTEYLNQAMMLNSSHQLILTAVENDSTSGSLTCHNVIDLNATAEDINTTPDIRLNKSRQDGDLITDADLLGSIEFNAPAGSTAEFQFAKIFAEVDDISHSGQGTASSGKLHLKPNSGHQSFKTVGSDTTAGITLNSDGQVDLLKDGAGIRLLSPNGTEFVLTVSNFGALVIT